MNNLFNSGSVITQNEKNLVRLSLQFEEGPPYSPGVIEFMAKTALSLIKKNPLAAAAYPFFDAAKAGDWFSGKPLMPNPAAGQGLSNQKPQRLKAIKLGAEILVEHTYRPDGRLGSTRYADGEMLGFDWDDVSHTVRVRSRSGRQTLIKQRADDSVESITYENNQRFQYEYDLNDRPCRLTYPDGQVAQRSFGQRDELVSASVGAVRTTFQWGSQGDFEGYVVQNGTGAHAFKAADRKLECDLSAPSSVSTQTTSATVVHALGAWRMTPQGGLEEMVTPWGDRYRVQSSAQGCPTAVWGPNGRHYYEYSAAGLLSAITGPDGSRTMIHPLKDQPKAVLVGPGSVTLLEYDSEGHLRKRRQGDGGYCLYDYARSGVPKKIETFFATTKLSHDKSNRLAGAKFDIGCQAKLVRVNTGELQRLLVEGLAVNAPDKLTGLAGFLWQWLALRPTLRLESPIKNGGSK